MIFIFSASCWYALGFFFSKNFPIFALFNVRNALLSANIMKEIEWKTQNTATEDEEEKRNTKFSRFSFSSFEFIIFVDDFRNILQHSNGEKYEKSFIFPTTDGIKYLQQHTLSRALSLSFSWYYTFYSKDLLPNKIFYAKLARATECKEYEMKNTTLYPKLPTGCRVYIQRFNET